jgi:hypothetical protein
MALKFGSADVAKLYLGSTQVSGVYLGSVIASVALTAPVLLWTSPQTDTTPEFTVDVTAPQVGDTATVQLANDSGFTTGLQTFTSAAFTSTEVGNLAANIAMTTQANGTYYARAKHSRGGVDSAWSNTVTVTIAAIVPVASSLGAVGLSGNGQTQTTTATPIGTAAPTRSLVFAVALLNEVAATSLSLVPKTGATTHATVTATKIFTPSATSGIPGLAWFAAAVPDGTTADFTLGFASNPFNTARIFLFPVTDLSSLTPLDAQESASTAATTRSVALSTTAGSVILAAMTSLVTASQSGGIAGDATYADGMPSLQSGNGMYLESAYANTVGTSAVNTVTGTFTQSGGMRFSALCLK